MKTPPATFVDFVGPVFCRVLLLLGLAGVGNTRAASTDMNPRTVETPPFVAETTLYTGNRAPLLPSPFLKLPIGSITPKGWLRGQLEIEAEGMTGHLEEISKWCKFEDSAWASPTGEGKFGWEELPYWLKGYGDLGYVLGDQEVIRHARKWIDAVLASQQPDGYFGPRANKTGLEGKPDLWPHMVMCNVLESFYEYTGDSRVIPFLTRYFQWLNTLPGESFGAGYWPKIRFGDNIQSIYWLYNHTGDSWLLPLAKRIHDNMARWDTGVINWHNVNIAEGFREPTVFYQQSKEQRHLQGAERNYQAVMGLYGQFPGGGFAGDENCRPGYDDPRQGFETCGWVEFMHSFEMLTKITGNPVWADRCEEVAFNSLPASLTPDGKALHYLTCANQIQLDRKNKAPAIDNGGNMFAYSPYEVYRCCQHNVSHGWPYYAEELWLATSDRGLCASLYAANEVQAKVGNGTEVRISEETDYPFGETVSFRFSSGKPVEFPLYLRVPRWCAKPTLKVNGKTVRIAPKPLSFLVLQREWKDGDLVTLELPMRVSVRKWDKNKNAVSVDYGPITFSLRIGERWSRYGGTDRWPETEVYPTTPWNYGLVLEQSNPARSFRVIKRPLPVSRQPFTPDTVPLEIQAKARKIPGWTQDWFGLVGKLQASPAKSKEPVETITLIPMGASRLRITSFPVIARANSGTEWVAPKPSPVSASHCNPGDTVDAMVDGSKPKSSDDRTVPRFTWWDHRGTQEWVQHDFGKQRTVSSVEVYWFDDTGTGNCRVPASWRILYQDGERWVPVQELSGCGTNRDRYNRASFKAVSTTGLRLEVKLQPEFSGGILEWKIVGQ